MFVSISLGLAIGLVALGLIGMLVSGIQSIFKGKQDFKKIATMVVPFIIFGIAFAIAGSLTEAAIGTMLIMMAVMVLSILLTGIRGALNF